MLKDSGERRDFETGAVRDMAEGKGRCDLLPACALLRLAKLYEEGAKKYADRNWEKGIPVSVMIDSGMRHLLKYMDGQNDEDHLCAAAWNILGAMWMEEKRPELQDLPGRNLRELDKKAVEECESQKTGFKKSDCNRPNHCDQACEAYHQCHPKIYENDLDTVDPSFIALKEMHDRIGKKEPSQLGIFPNCAVNKEDCNPWCDKYIECHPKPEGKYLADIIRGSDGKKFPLVYHPEEEKEVIEDLKNPRRHKKN